MSKNKKFIFGTIILFFINIFSGLLGKEGQFISISIINFIISFYLLKINTFNKKGVLIVFLPFTLLFGCTLTYAIYLKNYSGIIIFSIYILSSLFSYLIIKSSIKKIIAAIYCFIVFTFYLNLDNINNFLFDLKNKNETVGELFPKIELSDKELEKIYFEKYKGKVLVLNIWNNTCGYCIKNFPEYEKVNLHYKNDTIVKVLSVNIIKNKSDIFKAEKLISNYSFLNFYTNNKTYNKLKINGVPYYVIIGKDWKIKYIGSLNSSEDETYNNIYKLIENEK